MHYEKRSELFPTLLSIFVHQVSLSHTLYHFSDDLNKLHREPITTSYRYGHLTCLALNERKQTHTSRSVEKQNARILTNCFLLLFFEN